MRNIILGSLLSLVVVGTAAQAQDYGLTAGLSQSNATAKNAGISSSGEFGFRLGGVAAFPLTDVLKFRTGLLYSQRHFDLTDAASNKATFKYDYLDIPVLAQFNFNENFGIFGGIIAAVNINNSASGTINGVAVSGSGPNTKGFIPIAQIGVSGTFDNMYGVEAYYEMGLGDIDDNAKNFSVFGANFIYWL